MEPTRLGGAAMADESNFVDELQVANGGKKKRLTIKRKDGRLERALKYLFSNAQI